MERVHHKMRLHMFMKTTLIGVSKKLAAFDKCSTGAMQGQGICNFWPYFAIILVVSRTSFRAK